MHRLRDFWELYEINHQQEIGFPTTHVHTMVYQKAHIYFQRPEIQPTLFLR